MLKLLQRRIMMMMPILFMVHLLTFILFFVVNSPDDIARAHLGQKYVMQIDIERWKKSHHLDMPLFFNFKEGMLQTVFAYQTLELLHGNFGQALNGENINDEIKHRMGPSLAIAIPSFGLSIFFHVSLALVLVYFRNTHLNQLGLIISITLLSISSLFYIIFFQYFAAYTWKWFPISGYEPGWSSIFFVTLPIIVHIFAGMGNGVRWYRTLLMEEIEQAYVITARASGLKEKKVLFSYVLRNALLPIVTGVVVVIPTLFLGSILYESFFSIPGLGNYLIEAIQKQDFSIVRAMVFLGSFSYMLGLILTDIVYLYIDPRVRLS
ncbi:MAG: ABC transporter permease [Gammaproteobacteria bacterium]|nr:ABC transporter permease [Gammaproteobacteria bacterium]